MVFRFVRLRRPDVAAGIVHGLPVFEHGIPDSRAVLKGYALCRAASLLKNREFLRGAIICNDFAPAPASVVRPRSPAPVHKFAALSIPPLLRDQAWRS